MAESAVKTTKRLGLLVKSVESGNDPYLAILDHRNTPMQDIVFNPAQGSLGRRTRTLLPMSSSLLKPQQYDGKLVKTRKALSYCRSKWYHDRGAKDLDELNEGDSVCRKPVLGKKHWDYGKVVEKLESISYVVGCNDGLLRRNRLHLRKSNKVESLKNVDQHVSIKADRIVNKDANVNDSKVIANDVNARNEPAVTVNSDTNSQRNVKNVGGHNEMQHNGMNRERRSTRNEMPDRFKDFTVTK